MIDICEIGRRIRRRRAYLDMTLDALSEKTGISIATLSRIEDGYDSARIGDLNEVTKALGMETIELFRRED